MQSRRAKTVSRSSWQNAASFTPSTSRRKRPNDKIHLSFMPESTQMSVLGKPQPRIDGPLKVSGLATYASDFHFPGMLYAVPVEATIANGRVVKLDTAAAEKIPGVHAIFHRENIGKIFRSVQEEGFGGIID